METMYYSTEPLTDIVAALSEYYTGFTSGRILSKPDNVLYYYIDVSDAVLKDPANDIEIDWIIGGYGLGGVNFMYSIQDTNHW